MLVRVKRGWELPESAATPEAAYLDRRRLLQGLAAGLALAAGAALMPRAVRAADENFAPADDPTAGLYPVERNPRYTVDRPLSDYADVATYNNFYEFGSHKEIWRAAQDLPIRPWTVEIGGMVEEPRTVDIDTLIGAMPLEERVYRHRCVEAWAITVPWTGFPMAALLAYARPLGSARYVEMQTFENPDIASGQRQVWYPWPYVEGLTIEEAGNELAFIATGIYGRPMPKQNGAPLRLVTPWKYGFKSVKSITRITFTDQRPKTFWEVIQPQEYGFWANINPEFDHPRWSQATERLLSTGERVPTRLYNGYGEFVAGLYAGHETERTYFM